MAKIGSLIADLGMNTANFQAGIKRAESATKRFSRNVNRNFQKINRAAGRMGTAILTAATVGFGALMALSLKAGDSIEKMNRRLGVSTEALSQMKFAAEQSGITFQTLTMAMQRAQRRIAEASEGYGEAKGALVELGLSATELNKLKPDQQLMAIADAMLGVADSGDKTRLAMKLFDSEGVALLQMTQDGSQGMRELMEEADRLGLTMNNKTAVGAANATDAINRAKAAMHGAALEATENAIPAIEDLGNGFSVFLPKAVNVSLRAFYTFREEGLKVFSFMISIIGRTQTALGNMMVDQDFSDKYEKLTKKLAVMEAIAAKASGKAFEERAKRRAQIVRDQLAALQSENAEAFRLLESGSFAERWTANMLDSAAAAASVRIEMEKIAKVGAMIANPDTDPFVPIKKMSAGMLEATNIAQQLGKTMKVDIFDSSRNMFQQMADQWKSTLMNMVNAFISSGIKDIFTNFFSSGTKGGKLAAVGSLFGFANGGSFDVGGKGGTDANVAAFKVTRGEEVIVNKKSGGGSGGGAITFYNSYDFSGSDLQPAQVQQMINESQVQTKNDIRVAMKKRRF